MLFRCVPLVIYAAALSGCGSVLTATTSDVAGIAGAGVASAVTKSPAAAAGIGLGIAKAFRDCHRAFESELDKVTLATPLPSVLAVDDESVPASAVKLTGTPVTPRPGVFVNDR